MMKKILLMAFIAITAVNSAMAQRVYPDGFLTEEQKLEDYGFIHQYPSLTGGEFMNDFYYYQWGRDQREDDEVSQQALDDEKQELYLVFQNTTKAVLTPEETPEILKLCEGAVADVMKGNTLLKNKYKRIRPFATFKEPSLKEWTDDEEAATFSFPSGHSARGYMFAFALCSLVPECTDQIMERAQMYAINRVICGHHWKSDIDASLLLASAMFAKVVCSEGYQAQYKKALEEYNRLTASGSTRILEVPAEQNEQRAAIYNLQGQRVDNNAQPGIYIKEGHKVIAK